MRFYRVETINKKVIWVNPFNIVSVERSDEDSTVAIISTTLDEHYFVNEELPEVRDEIERCLNGN